jgi:hypothetical protein
VSKQSPCVLHAAQVITECSGDVRLVAGNTGAGVYYNWPTQKRLVSIIQASGDAEETCSYMRPAVGLLVSQLCFPRLISSSLRQVPELLSAELVTRHTPAGADGSGPHHTTALRLGAAVTLSHAIDALTDLAAGKQPSPTPGHHPVGLQHSLSKHHLPGRSSGSNVGLGAGAQPVWGEMAAHLKRIAGSHVRNAATVVGNLVLARTRGLPSDVATVLMAAGGSVEVADAKTGCLAPKTVPLESFIMPSPAHATSAPPFAAALVGTEPGATQLVSAVTVPVPQVSGRVRVCVGSRPAFELLSSAAADCHHLPAWVCCLQAGTRFWSSRVAQRWANAAAVVNAALCVRVDPASGALVSARVVVGLDLCPTPGRYM